MRRDAVAEGSCCHGTVSGAPEGRAVLVPTAYGTLLMCIPGPCDIAMSMAAQAIC